MLGLLPIPSLIPILIGSRTVSCDRCGLNYPEQREKCSHCGDLSDLGVVVLKAEVSRQKRVLKKLAVLFLLVGALFTFLVLASVL